MITVDSSGNPISGAFISAMQQPQVGFDMALYIAGSGTVNAGIKRAVLELGAGYAMDELQTFTPCQLMSTQFEAQLYDLASSIMGARVEVRVGVWTGSSYEYVTAAHVTITEQSTWQGITTVKGKGILSLTNVPISLAEGDYTPAQIAAAVLSATGITVTVGSFSGLQSAHIDAGSTCRDALASLCARLGGYACELNGGISVRPYSSATTYTIPVDYVRDAGLGTIGYIVDGITVEAAGESFAYGTGRVHIEDPTATASTSAATWGNIQGYSFMPGSLKAAIIDPRVTPSDTVLFSYVDGGTTYSYSIPARGISITYDGGYFGTYMASGLTAQSEAELVDGPLSSRVASAYELAAEAEQIAAATGQYFWHDTAGAHVSTEALDPAGAQNTLWNTEGMLFRKETTNLLAILAGDTAATSGMAVYDGQGNDGSNILASFTGSGVTVGRESQQRVEITGDATLFYGALGTQVGEISNNGMATVTDYVDMPSLFGASGIAANETATGTLVGLPFVDGSDVVLTFQREISMGVESKSIVISEFGTVADTVFGVGFSIDASAASGASWTLSLTPDAAYSFGVDMAEDTVEWTHINPASYYVFGSGVATAEYAFSQGNGCSATDSSAHSEGLDTTASGIASHSEGNRTVASGMYSHAEGSSTSAQDTASHAEGLGTTARYGSHAEGRDTVADGMEAHAEGYKTHASGRWAHAEGIETLASSDYQHVGGRYNIEDANGTYAEIVGNGASGNARSNARTLDWNGNETLAGGLTLGSPLTIANGGTGATTAADARVNLLAVGYQSGMNAAIANFTGANQLWGLRAKVINTNSSLNGDSVYILLRDNGISCYDTTASSYPWQLTLPSGTTDLTVNVGTPTLNSNATATTFETRRQGKVVNLQVYQLKVAASLADGSSVSLGTGIIGSNARPAHNVYMPLMANVSGKGAGVFLYITSAGNVSLYNRSGSALGTGTNLAGNTTWVV